MSSVHALTLMSIGLYSDGLEWRKAIELRNSLMREANEAEPQIAKRTINDVEAIISFAGLPSFQIERVR